MSTELDLVQLISRLEGRADAVYEYSASDASKATFAFLETLQQSLMADLVECKPEECQGIQAQVKLLQGLRGLIGGKVKTNCRV